MKWNWGTGIVVGMIAFISFIMYFVIRMSTEEKYSHDMVTDEYYAKEMMYQTEIDAETNTYNLKERIKGEKTSRGWEITFPKELIPSKIQGTMNLYRPSNEKLDFSLPLKLDQPVLTIPNDKLNAGRWNITIDWTYNETPYLYKKQIIY